MYYNGNNIDRKQMVFFIYIAKLFYVSMKLFYLCEVRGQNEAVILSIPMTIISMYN